MTQPADALQTPVADDPLPEAIAYFAGGNFVSPAYYISKAIESVAGVDPFGWASEQVAGDWEMVKQAGNAAQNLATFNVAFGDAVTSGWKSDVESTWRGNAADNARGYFDSFAGSVDLQAGSLHEIGRTLNNIGNSMMNLARLIGDYLQDLVDRALLYLTGMAAGAAFSSSVVGSPAAGAAYAVAAAHAALMAISVNAMMDLVTKTYTRIVALCAAAQELSRRAPKELPPLPAAAYDHPGA